jgi:hypothetical protein
MQFFLFLFCVRGTIEAKGVLHIFGDRAYRRILAALDALYEATFPESASVTGLFQSR